VTAEVIRTILADLGKEARQRSRDAVACRRGES
jgi:hypothetical protein